MGNKIYKMLKMNFKNDPIILTSEGIAKQNKFIEGIYAFAVSDKKLLLGLSETNYVETKMFKDKKFCHRCFN